jgi:hypothetical protein
MDTRQDWYWYAESEDSPDTIHPVQPRCLEVKLPNSLSHQGPGIEFKNILNSWNRV